MTQEQIKERLRYVFGKQLRRLFKFSGLRTMAKKAQPYCSECGAEDYLEIDHEPAVCPPDRDITDPLEYFLRMFCMDAHGNIDLGKLNVLCSDCHQVKTDDQMQQRAFHGTGPYSKRSKEKAAATRARRKIIRKKKRKKRKAK